MGVCIMQLAKSVARVGVYLLSGIRGGISSGAMSYLLRYCMLRGLNVRVSKNYR